MKQARRKYHPFALRRVIPAISMMLLLTLLTSMNFFIYTAKDAAAESSWTATNEEESPESSNPCSPAGPDEKAPNKPVSVNEEYIHEGPDLDHPFWIDPLFAHKIHEAEKLQIVHSELLTPPPKV
ncbi:hypothetical protein [Paraflavitalea pollutisoli]|uniref:hypothetical protein n=1 Tax=Paraflavitalea pollutisoli TaxID=3034143 RepID=UPI0023EBC2EF|nr:hypothetical protein [Paraflavitalea sp. H1-2-19X]